MKSSMLAKPVRIEGGKGDRLGYKVDGLTWVWRWPNWKYDTCQRGWHGGPGYQVASASRKTKFGLLILETVRWSESGSDSSHSYEGVVMLENKSLASIRGCKTRIESQKAAERLVVEVGEVILKVGK